MKKSMLCPLVLALVSTAASAQTFVWHKTGSANVPSSVSTYSSNAPGFTNLIAANPNSGNFAWAKNLGAYHYQYNSVGQRMTFRVYLSSLSVADHVVVMMNYSPFYGSYCGSSGCRNGVVANAGVIFGIGRDNGCGPNSIGLEAVWQTGNFTVPSSCRTAPSNYMVVDLEVTNHGWVNAWVSDAYGVQPSVWIGENMAPHFPGGTIPQFIGYGFASVTPHEAPQGYYVSAEVLSHYYLVP